MHLADVLSKIKSYLKRQFYVAFAMCLREFFQCIKACLPIIVIVKSNQHNLQKFS